MALSRSMLKGMNLTEEQVDAIIEEHAAAKNNLKDRISKLEKEIEENGDYKSKYESLAESVKKDDWKSKFDSVTAELKEFKEHVANEKRENVKRDAYKNLLKSSGISDKQLDAIIKVTDLANLELDEEGKFKDESKLAENIKNEWSGFIVNSETSGINTETPPANKSSMTKDEILNIKDTSKRQQAIADNMNLFSIKSINNWLSPEV